MRGRLTIGIDCADKERAATFWAAVLGYERSGGVAQYVALSPSEGEPSPKVIVQEVADAKVAKNRMHLDIDLDAGVDLDAEVARVLALGATTVWGPVDEFGLRWVTLADPDGNEFCIVAQS